MIWVHQQSTVVDIGLRDATDAEIWSWAAMNGYTVISKDEDFVTLSLIAPGAALLWVRIGNTRRANILSVFRDSWPRITARLREGERFIELHG